MIVRPTVRRMSSWRRSPMSRERDWFRMAAMRGPAAARNTIVSAAKGEFIAFFDDDDESLPGRISAQVKTLTAYESRIGTSLIACYASGIRRYPNGYSIALPAIGSRGKTAPQRHCRCGLLAHFPSSAGLFLWLRYACLLAHGAAFDRRGRRRLRSRAATRGGRRLCHSACLARRAFRRNTRNSIRSARDEMRPTNHPKRTSRPNNALFPSTAITWKRSGASITRRRWQKLRHWHFSRRYGQFTGELFGTFYALSAHGHVAPAQYRPAAASAREPHAPNAVHASG